MRLLLALLPALALAQPPYDVLIKNGRIADGTGNPTFLADLALTGGKITAIGKLNGLAKRTIDATGMIVAPGFIDIHNHSDTSLLADGNAQSFIRQGVSSSLSGPPGSWIDTDTLVALCEETRPYGGISNGFPPSGR